MSFLSRGSAMLNQPPSLFMPRGLRRYLTGCAVHHRAKLSSIPDWLAQPSLQLFAFPPQAAQASVLAPSVPEPSHTFGGASVFANSSCSASASGVVALTGAKPSGNPRLAKPTTSVVARSRLQGANRVGPRLVDRAAGRADPKIFFANERTFIQWLSAGSTRAVPLCPL